MNLSRIIIFVADTIRCVSFYRDNFGLTAIGEWSEEWAELNGESCRLAFHQAYGPDGKANLPTGSSNNPHKIVFTVPDVEKSRNELVEKGVKMEEIFRNKELDNLILCDGYDPENHRFQICNR